MDRITHLRIKNVRAIESLDLELSRLTVLIGENGAGKSTILECLEVLRKVTDARFLEPFSATHQGLFGLLRKGATTMTLGVVIQDEAGVLPALDYEFTLESYGSGAVIDQERLFVSGDGTPRAVITRESDSTRVVGEDGVVFSIPKSALAPAGRLVLPSFGMTPPHSAIGRVLTVLERIEVHLGFDTVASWAARSYQTPQTIRGSIGLFTAPRLSLLGTNLANAWNALKNRESAHWAETMSLVQLGLGDNVDTVMIPTDAGGGAIALALKLVEFNAPILASSLSDGQLAWLAFVAMVRLNEDRSLLAIDEPELHLHPQLLAALMALLSKLKSPAPVLLSTHSDKVLELLDDPADAVRVCALTAGHRATVTRVDAEALGPWLERFRDFGALRASGYLDRVLRQGTGAEP